MIRLIFKNLWARRYRNGWLLAELVVVTAVMWHLLDPVTVLTYNRTLPMGFQTEGLYSLSFASLKKEEPGYVAAENTEEAHRANFYRMMERIRLHKDVQFVTFLPGAEKPYDTNQSNYMFEVDSVEYRCRMMYFTPQTDFFQTFGFDEVDGQTNEALDSLFFNEGEYCISKGAFPGKQMLGYRYIVEEGTINPYTGQPERNWTAIATISSVRMGQGQPESVVLIPRTHKNAYRWSNSFLIRTKPGVSERQFLHEFRPWAEQELRIGNFRVQQVQSYEEVMADYYENGWENTNQTYRMSLIMAFFFLANLFLGVAGTFWMQTRSRREEVGVMKSFGGSSGFVVRLLLGEGWVLTTVATLIGCILYLQYAVSEGLYGTYWGVFDKEYWVSNFWPHFFGVSALVWVVLLLVVSVGIWIPARGLSQITPVEALRDE